MATDVDLVIPVYDEEATLEVSVRRKPHPYITLNSVASR